MMDYLRGAACGSLAAGTLTSFAYGRSTAAILFAVAFTAMVVATVAATRRP